MGNFKKLYVWQDSVSLSANIYHITRKIPFSKDFGLSNQIQRAAVSIASNIAEGEERRSDKAAIYFFNIAKGSAAEVITQLHIAHKIGYIDVSILNQLEKELDKIRATLQSLINKKGNGYSSSLVHEPYLGNKYYNSKS